MNDNPASGSREGKKNQPTRVWKGKKDGPCSLDVRGKRACLFLLSYIRGPNAGAGQKKEGGKPSGSHERGERGEIDGERYKKKNGVCYIHAIRKNQLMSDRVYAHCPGREKRMETTF